MTINLSQFVDKEVFVTLRCGEIIEAKIIKDDVKSFYPYRLSNINDEEDSTTYTIEGTLSPSGGMSEYDIVNICLKSPTKPMNTPELPESTIEKLAEVLSPDAVKYITGTEEYVTFMTEMLTKFVREQVGTLHSDNECELVTSMVCSKIYLSTVK